MARSELVYAELWELVKSLLPDRAYSPKCLEGEFSELRVRSFLRSSLAPGAYGA
jgi:hypothetical protein